ncbi:MAG TPA: cation:proton antiporter [Acidimicrobiales bacterium]|nr:cation:proton antiporter [Acidimicrobiales bacterium]
MSHFPSLSEHELLVFWAQLLVVVGLARGLGALFQRFGQPPIVGELAAGVVLGPSILGKVWAGGFDWLFPTGKTQASALGAVGWLGVALLLVLTGFETDVEIIRRLGRAAGSVAAGALAIPFGCGLLIGTLLPAGFVGAHSQRVVFTLFVGVGLSISSLPVIAKILSDLGFMRRNFGQVTVAVGMVNDLVGWLALGVIAGLAESHKLSGGRLMFALAAAAVLLVATFTVGQRSVDRVLRTVRSRSQGVVPPMTVTLLVTFLMAVIAQAIKLEAVLGAFLAGIILGRSRFQHREVGRHLEAITMSVLAPVFFATAGLRLDLGVLAKRSTLLWTAGILVAAVVSKAGGAYLGARVGGLGSREGLALGSALNARGAVEVVIATVGLSLGVLGMPAYTAIVVMAIVTSMMAPPLLRLIMRDWPGETEERERLEKEALLDRNLLVRPGRLLIPSRGRPNSIVAAQILHFAWPDEVPFTVLSVKGEEGGPDLTAIENVLADRETEFREVDSDTLGAILQEVRLGYTAIGVGVNDAVATDGLLSPVVDDLLADSPVPLVVVRRARKQETATPSAFVRALVPVSGTPASRAAKELAFGLSRNLGTRIVLAHVVNRPDAEPVAAMAAAVGERRVGPGLRSGSAADAVLDQAVGVAEEFDVAPTTITRTGTSTSEEILGAAGEVQADLIVMGATVRRLDGRPFLGHNVEQVLEQAPMTVVVVAMPDVTPASPDGLTRP